MEQCEIIAVANQKGGVGKTTTTFNLGVALARQGKKILLVDFDPQGDLTTYMGWHNNDDINNTISSLMLGVNQKKEINPSDFILNHEEGVDLIPSNIELASLEVNLVEIIGRERMLANALKLYKDNYDFILIDCMPSLGFLTINALGCADKVIIPVQPHFLAAKGMNQLMSTMLQVRDNINDNLKVGGILITMADNRTNLSRNITQQIKDTYGITFKVFKVQIPRAIKTAESTSTGESVLTYDKYGKVSQAFSDLAKEVLGNDEQIQSRHSKADILSR